MRFIQSLRAAGRGARRAFQTEPNFRLQVLGAVLALSGAIFFRLPAWQFIVIIFLITMVLTMELLNTAIEFFTDLLKPRLHQYVSVIKDIMAAAVLATSVGAFIVGLIIFWPYFIGLFR